MIVRTRFAPSPTGMLHVGGLRTALYNYLFAKQNHGKFVLRIEDTDQKRIIKHASDKIVNIIHAFNLLFDEGPGLGGKYGPYTQSQRLSIYKKYYLELIKNDCAYVCFFDPKIPTKLYPEFDKDVALEKINSNFIVLN